MILLLLLSFLAFAKTPYPYFYYKDVIDNYNQKAPVLHIQVSEADSMPVHKRYLKANPQLAGALFDFMKDKKTVINQVTDYLSKNKDFNSRKSNFINYLLLLEDEDKDVNSIYHHFVESLPDYHWIYPSDTGDHKEWVKHLYYSKMEPLKHKKCGTTIDGQTDRISNYPWRLDDDELCTCTIGCAMIDVDASTLLEVVNNKVSSSFIKKSVETIFSFRDMVISNVIASDNSSDGFGGFESLESSKKNESQQNQDKDYDYKKDLALYENYAKVLSCKEDEYMIAVENVNACKTNCEPRQAELDAVIKSREKTKQT